jgi:uncharacterized protein (TIGR01244 family)
MRAGVKVSEYVESALVLASTPESGYALVAGAERRGGSQFELQLAPEEPLMNVKRAVTSTITIGDQPTESDLEALKREGYKGVVNLRNDGEPEQPLGTAAEGEKVRALGLEYLHYGVGGAPLSEPGVKAVCDFIDAHAQGAGKVLVHCRKGARADALVLLQQARANNWSGDQVFSKGKAMGLEIDGGLKTLVENYMKATGKP